MTYLIFTVATLRPTVQAGKNANNPFCFTGYQTDEVSGLYFAQARYYEPKLGRFVAEDLIKGVVTFPTSLNQYTYCWGSPLNFFDLNGLSPMPPWVGEGDEAHRLLQKYLADTTHGVQVGGKGIGIPGAAPNNGLYGFPDVVYRPPVGRTEIYEIKPYTELSREAGLAQLQRYLDNMKEPARRGTTLNPLICGHTEDSILNPGQKIRYFTMPSDPGMIYYEYDRNQSPDPVPVPEPALEKSKEKETNWGRVGEVVGGVALATICAIGIVAVVADDATGIGTIDDFLLGPLGAGLTQGFAMIGG